MTISFQLGQCYNDAAIQEEEKIQGIFLSGIFLEAVTQKTGLGIWNI